MAECGGVTLISMGETGSYWGALLGLDRDVSFYATLIPTKPITCDGPHLTSEVD